MNGAVNSPYPQSGLVVWTLLCSFGAWLSLQKIGEFAVGTTGWQAGWLLLAMTTFAFASIGGWWLWSQREVAFGPDLLRVRRWLDIMLGRDGVRIPLDPTTRASLIVDSGRFLVITRGDQVELRVWIGLWDKRPLGELAAAFARIGIDLATAGLP